MADLFQSPPKKAAGKQAGYSAKDIEVLEGLEPVRSRPGMYIGGSAENAMHHLVAEVLDNAMDDAVAGHASRLEIEPRPRHRGVIRHNDIGRASSRVRVDQYVELSLFNRTLKKKNIITH